MAHGLPDFGVYTPKVTVSALADMAELAARLGSIVTFDRRGDLVWFDDFRSGIMKWYYSGTGDRGSAVATAARARNGAFSCLITTGDQESDYAQIAHRSPYQVAGRLGIEASFTLDDNMAEYLLELVVYNGATYYSCKCIFDPTTNELKVGDSADFHVVGSNVAPFISDYLFNTMKIVANFGSTKKYLKLIFNELEYDISAYDLFTDTDDTGAHLAVNFKVQTNVADAKTIYVTDVIVTQNEPE